MTINYRCSTLEVFLDKLLSFLSFIHSPLTDTEVLILKTFLSLPPKYRYHRFSSAGRKAAIKSLQEKNIKLSSANLNNRLYSLIDKKYLRRDEDNVIYVSDFLEKITDIYTNKHSLSVNLNFIEDRSNTATDTKDSQSTLPSDR